MSLLDVNLNNLRRMGERMEADFHLRRAYGFEQIQLISKAANEIAGLRAVMANAYANEPGCKETAAYMLGKIEAI
jgi:hypothetical protein